MQHARSTLTSAEVQQHRTENRVTVPSQDAIPAETATEKTGTGVAHGKPRSCDVCTLRVVHNLYAGVGQLPLLNAVEPFGRSLQNAASDRTGVVR